MVGKKIVAIVAKKKTTTTTKLAFEEPECVSVSRRPLGRQHVRRESPAALVVFLQRGQVGGTSVGTVHSLIPAKGSDFPVPLDVAPPFHPPTPPKKGFFFCHCFSKLKLPWLH